MKTYEIEIHCIEAIFNEHIIKRYKIFTYDIEKAIEIACCKCINEYKKVDFICAVEYTDNFQTLIDEYNINL